MRVKSGWVLFHGLNQYSEVERKRLNHELRRENHLKIIVIPATKRSEELKPISVIIVAELIAPITDYLKNTIVLGTPKPPKVAFTKLIMLGAV